MTIITSKSIVLNFKMTADIYCGVCLINAVLKMDPNQLTCAIYIFKQPYFRNHLMHMYNVNTVTGFFRAKLKVVNNH